MADSTDGRRAPDTEGEPAAKRVRTESSDPAPNFECTASLSGHSRAISSCKFSPDGKWLVSASADKTAIIWSLETKGLHAKLEGHTAGLSDCAWSADSQYVATASDDKGNLLASGSFDESVRIWDVQTGACRKVLPAHSDPVSSVAFNHDGTLIVSGSYDGLCRIWDAARGDCQRTLVQDDTPPVSHVSFSPNGKYLLVATLDSKLRLWDIDRTRCVKTYKGHKNVKYCIFSAFCVTAGKWIVCGSEDSKVFVWHLNSREVLQTLDAAEQPVLAISAHPTETMIATGGLGDESPEVKLWEHVDGSKAEVNDDGGESQ